MCSFIEKVCFRSELAVATTRTATIKEYIKLLYALDKGDSHQCYEAFRSSCSYYAVSSVCKQTKNSS